MTERDYYFVDAGSTDAHSVYARPRVPSKANGRRGTRRSWKRENPPGVYMHVVCTDASGAVRDEYLTRW